MVNGTTVTPTQFHGVATRCITTFTEVPMHIKTRGIRAMLYRSTWVRKGTEGNTHGFSRQTYLGSIPLDAQSLPLELAEILSGDEKAFLEKQVLQPARVAADAKRAQIEHHRRDPIQRLDAAGKLINEAVLLSQNALVPYSRIKGLSDALAGVKTFGAVQSLPPPLPAPRPEPTRLDPLADALKAIKLAAKAVREGHYGHAPIDKARSSKTYAIWMEISKEIEGKNGADSLLRALQGHGWVKVRGAAAR
jgi:hypothetical protein